MQSSAISSSALDVNAIVTSLMEVERQPLLKLSRDESRIQAKISALGTIKSALASLQTAASNLASVSTFQGFKASVLGDQVVATTDSTAVAGDYSIEVQTLAKAQSLASAAQVSEDTVIGGGTLTFQPGTYDSGMNTFTDSATEGAIEVTIAAGSSLAQIRDAINASGANVTASLVTDANGTRLSLLSKNTGADNGFRITAVDDDSGHTDMSGLSQLAFDPTAGVGTGKNLTQTRAPEDATVVINGLTINSSSNVITSAIQGVTLTLRKEDPGVTAELNVAADTGAAKAAVEAFVKAYNAVETALSNSMAYEPTTGARAALNGDSTPRSIQAQLRAMISGSQSGAATYATLSSVGVSFERSGQLKFDSATFDAAMAADPQRVQDLFSLDDGTASTSGFGVLVGDRVDSLLGNTGVLQARTEGFNASLDRLNERELEITRRLEATEARLRKQYAALDAQLANMQGVSASLANALSQLPGAYSGGGG